MVALPFCHVALMTKKPPSKAYPKGLITLGDHIRKRRLDRGLLQKEAGRILGVDTTTVYNWENSQCSPRLCLIPKIVQFLGDSPFPSESAGTLGEGIKAYRLVHGLSQKKLAKVLRIDPTTLARWEKSRSRPGPRLSKRLAGLLGVSVDAKLTKVPTTSD